MTMAISGGSRAKRRAAGPWWIGSALIAACGAVVGCSPEQEVVKAPPTVTDSAGIRMVESGYPAWGEVSPWWVDLEPLVVIGAQPDEPDALLFGVTEAAKLSDGRILVANAGTFVVKVFRKDGSLHSQIGGKGEGPGEFRFPGPLRVTEGDTIVLWEGDARGRARFSAQGELIEHTRLSAAVIPNLQNAFEPSGRGEAFFLLPDLSSELGSEARRLTQWLARVTADGSRIDTLGVWPTTLRRAMRIGASSTSVSAPFSPTTVLTTGGRPERVLIGDSEVPVLHVLDLDGHEVLRIRWDEHRRTPSPQDLDVAMERAVRFRPEPERTRRAEALRSFRVGPVPAFDQLILDRMGHVWARRFVLPSDTAASWNVFDPAGIWLGVVTVPTGLNLTEIGPDYILGVVRDELDVELVVELALGRGG